MLNILHFGQRAMVLSNALYCSFEQEKGTNQNEQRSNFKKREFERFCIAFDVNSTEWKQYKFRISDLGMSDMLHLNKVRYISLFNMTLNSSGRLWIDDFAFTNIGDKLTGQSVSHATPVKSEPIGELVTKYPANKAIQIPKTFELRQELKNIFQFIL